MYIYLSLILSVLTYGCESWTLNANITKKIQAFETIMHNIQKRQNQYICQKLN